MKNKIIIALLVLIAVTGFLLYLKGSQKRVTTTEGITPSVVPTERPATGMFELTASETEPTVGQPTKVTVRASSDGKDVVGYDVILPLSPTEIKDVSVKSLVPDFQIFTNENEDYLAVTGIKGLTSKNVNVLSETPLIEITFTPLKAGTLSVFLFEEKGREVTKFVDTDTKLYYPTLTSLDLVVR